jgi:N12 class adenine-specific DNA methylase
VRTLEREGRRATDDEQRVLARWAGWGALAHAFDEHDPAGRRLHAELTGLLTDAELASARRSTLNAHYTDAGITTAMWRFAVGLGFDGGRVLEPGCGTGVFLATRPDNLVIDATGVEVEPVTARIAALLHPDADIRSEGFETTRLAHPVDLVIGNVPFAKVALHDPVHNRGRHSIHNHFLVKALALTRPGGLLVAITSRYTLDSRNPAARRELAALGDFVGAARLPSAAHRAAAGTAVVTDIVVFRRRSDGEVPSHAGPWQASVPLDIDGGVRPVNEWFASEAALVVGRLVAGNGVYGREDLSVELDEPLEPALDAALDRVASLARQLNLAYRARSSVASLPSTAVAPRGGVPAGAKEGSIHRAGSSFVRVVGGVPQPFQPSPRKDTSELVALCDLRDTTIGLLDAQAQHVDDARCLALQAELNDRYDRYVERFGPLNRFRLVRTGRTDPVTGADLYRRMNPAMGGFDDDPDFRTLLALEDFDPDSQTATKAAIFSRRLLAPAAARYGADTADDALAVSLDETGRVDLDRIAELLDRNADEALGQLADRVYRDPTTGEFVPAEQYLSGDVRVRLDAARAAAESDTAFAANVAALERVLPADLTSAEIDARLGAPWIPAADVEVFCTDLLGADGIEVEHAPLTAMWAIAATTWSRRTVAATSEWGTARADAVALIEASLNQRPATVYDTLEDGTRVVNPAETIAAREKQEAIDARFAEWLWSDGDRADRLARVYNRTFNATVLARYDGSHLTLPGLSAAFTPHPHQRDAVWRIVSTGDTLLAHAVGAGKTATMVMAAMEQRRLGLVEKPAFIVPNHMLDQFARELLQLYPSARVLVATREDASPAGRKQFVARCATGSWDAVVLTHSSFERIPLAAATRAEFTAERMEEFRAAIAESASGKGLTVKRLEATLARLEARHQELADAHKKDDGATFEQTGIDFVFCDEAHAFKNKAFPTRIQGVGGAGSKRSEDLDTKLWWLRRRHGSRAACFATATPIANSIAELYVAQTYLQPAALAAAGIGGFDAWAATFAATVASLELSPDGGSYRLTHRLARYRNVPELVTLARQVADVRTSDQLDLPVPHLRGGRAETVVAAPSDELRDYVASLVDRAQAVRERRVPPEEDNMLKVTGDGRKAALDLRLVGRRPDPTGGKIAAAADRIAAIHLANADRAYVGPSGDPSPRPGAMQFVFCDLGTPSSDRWNVYDHLKALLVERGVPAERVRFVHDATNDRAKADLFAGCRDGRVSVLVGSTEKMGVGTNAQDRAVALHHLDCPWRPADIEQREGRIRRQGNQNPEVEIIRYVTEGSFDIFMWQTVERKAAFIAQVMHGGTVAREIDDVGDHALSYAEVKALATGNPHIVEKAGVDAEVAKLTRLRTAHQRDQSALSRTHASASARAQRLEREAALCAVALDRRVDTRADHFHATIAGTRHASRADAGAHLRQLLSTEREVAGSFAGFELRARADRHSGLITLALEPSPITVELDLPELAEVDPGRLMQRLEHRLGRLERDLDDARTGADIARAEGERAAARLDQPFEHADRLTKVTERQAELERLLTPEPEPPAVEAPSVADRLAAVSAEPAVRTR